jgi:hypothetical protein
LALAAVAKAHARAPPLGAKEGYAACADALTRAPGDPVFERSLAISKRRLALLEPRSM